jgi:hypothetical protein
MDDLITIKAAAIELCHRDDLDFNTPESARQYIFVLRTRHGLAARPPTGRSRPLRVSRTELLRLITATHAAP